MKQALETLYFIDDSDDERFLTEILFGVERINLKIRHFFNLQEFESFFTSQEEQKSFGLLIVDLNMPIQNGVEIVDHLKNRKKYENLVIGICTGSEDPADKKNANSAGADFFIKKPFDTKSLKKTCEIVPKLDLITDDEGRKSVRISQ